MNVLLFIVIIVFIVWVIIKLIDRSSKNDDYNRGTDHYNKGEDSYNKGSKSQDKKTSKSSIFSIFKIKLSKSRKSTFLDFFLSPLPFDNEALIWCANLLALDNVDLKKILRNIPAHYKSFRIGKRSGGYRTISAPNDILLSVQKTIYRRILLPVNIHSAATGFRQRVSIVDNAKPHLGNNNILKTDIIDFFGSITQYTVIKSFENIGYPANIAKVLAELCCLNKQLPQGAPTSPALSNIVAYEMDKKLMALSNEHGLIYTRYADDLTFSGDISQDVILPQIKEIVEEESFTLKTKKTRFINKNRRKIVTGISISSGEKLTIPKSKKRELRKNIHFILAKGLVEHQKYIKSTDPVYLKRTLGYLSFWLSVEPENKYVIDSIKALRKLNK